MPYSLIATTSQPPDRQLVGFAQSGERARHKGIARRPTRSAIGASISEPNAMPTNPLASGCFIYGRSDSTLNRFGVRIGSAEIYRVIETVPEIADSLIVCCELPDGEFYMPLFVATKPGHTVDDALKARITKKLREEASPRHVPDEIIEAPVIPYTLTGKKMEVPIRKLLMGILPEKAASRDAMTNPAALDWFISFADRQDIRARRKGTA
jgi:acetoacetyl-CoA synthetase